MMINNFNGLDDENDELEGDEVDEEKELVGFHEVNSEELDGDADEDEKPGPVGLGSTKDGSDDFDDSAKNDW